MVAVRNLNPTAPLTGNTMITNPPAPAPTSMAGRVVNTLPPAMTMDRPMVQLSADVVKQLHQKRAQLLQSIVQQINEGKGAFITSKRDGRQIPMLLALDMDTIKGAFDKLVDFRDEVCALLEQGS